jgi:hypothetical protein
VKILVCEKCKGYYKLQEGESPEDFDQCQCSGKLRYYENISEFENTETDDEKCKKIKVDLMCISSINFNEDNTPP